MVAPRSVPNYWITSALEANGAIDEGDDEASASCLNSSTNDRPQGTTDPYRLTENRSRTRARASILNTGQESSTVPHYHSRHRRATEPRKGETQAPRTMARIGDELPLKSMHRVTLAPPAPHATTEPRNHGRVIPRPRGRRFGAGMGGFLVIISRVDEALSVDCLFPFPCVTLVS